jgi:hypothetical protein
MIVTTMANDIDEDVIQYCRQCTDAQLEEVLSKEYDAYEHRDYYSARIAAAERGWVVVNGERHG